MREFRLTGSSHSLGRTRASHSHAKFLGGEQALILLIMYGPNSRADRKIIGRSFLINHQQPGIHNVLPGALRTEYYSVFSFGTVTLKSYIPLWSAARSPSWFTSHYPPFFQNLTLSPDHTGRESLGKYEARRILLRTPSLTLIQTGQ